jgi:hypothetical protein
VKKREQKKHFFIGDIVVFLTILILAVASFFAAANRQPDDRPVAVITHKGVEIQRIDLSKVTERIVIRIDGKYDELIIAESGRIRFLESNCPDKICVHTGWISKPGQVAVCLPEGVIIKITGSSGSDEEIDIYLR